MPAPAAQAAPLNDTAHTEVPAQLRAAEPHLAPGDSVVLTPRPGAPLEIVLASEHPGRLHVWATGALLDPALTLLVDGVELAENLDADATGSAWIQHDLTRATLATAPSLRVRLEVQLRAGADLDEGGAPPTVSLTLALERDDAAARAAADSLDAVLSRASMLRADGDGPAADALVAEQLGAWRADPELFSALGTSARLERAAQRCAEWQEWDWALGWQQLRLEAVRAVRPPTWPEVALARHDLAWALARVGRDAEAAAAFSQAAHDLSAALPSPHPVQLEMLAGQVDAELRLARADAALQACERHVALTRRLGLTSDTAILSTHALWAESLAAQGLAGRVLSLASESLRGLEARLDEDDFDVIVARSCLGRVLYFAADLEQAEQLQRRTLAQLEHGRAADRAILRMQLARTLMARDRHLQARDLAEQVVADLAAEPGLSRVEALRAESLLADCMMLTGDLEQALVRCQALLPEFEQLLGSGHAEVLETRRSAAYLLWDLGRRQEGLQAMAALGRGVRPEGLRAQAVVWSVRAFEAYMANWLGDVAGASAIIQTLEQGDPGSAATLEERLIYDHIVALQCLRTGATERALALCQSVLAQLGERSALADVRVHTLGVLAEVQLARGDKDASRAVAAELVVALHRGLDALVRAASQRELEAALGAHASEMGQLVRLARELPGLVPEVVSLCERMRGLGLATARWVRQAPDDARGRALQGQLRARDAELLAAAAQGSDLDAARRARDLAQRALVEHLATGGSGAAASSDEPGAGVLAIGFLAVLGLNGEPELTATLRRAGQPPALVHLGALEPVRAAVACWRRALGVPSDESLVCDTTSIRVAGRRLAELVLQPLAAWIEAAPELVILPDDCLHLVPLDGLPFADGYLGEGHRCHREWGVLAAPAPADDGSLVLVGALDYGGEVTLSEPARGDEPGRFALLPAAALELDAVMAWQAARAPAAPVQRLGGDALDAAGFAELVPGAATLHVATHAWARPIGGGARQGGSFDPRSLAPLLNTGLALSRANLDPSGRLTGEQLASFDLESCRLAVLAGCATNAGELRTWQGVASLTQAAHMAGARVVVSSLWPVSDRWTRMVMDHFYRGLWIEKLDPEEALWRAKMSVREQSPLPRHWAGWIVSRLAADS